MKIKFTKKEKELIELLEKENYVYYYSWFYAQEIDNYTKQLKVFKMYGLVSCKTIYAWRVTELGKSVFKMAKL